MSTTPPTAQGESLAMAREIVAKLQVLGVWQAPCSACGGSTWLDTDASANIIATALTQARQEATRQERERAAGILCTYCKHGYKRRDGGHEHADGYTFICHAAAILAAATPAASLAEKEDRG